MRKLCVQSVQAEALAAGFTRAVSLNVTTLRPLPAVRAACEENRCGMFGRCWVCPPGCGTLAECEARIRTCSSGLLVQTAAAIEDPFDYEGMLAVEAAHQQRFSAFAAVLGKAAPGLIALGAGGCRVCTVCAYPDAPCRFPAQAVSSMEAYGLLVSDVCKMNGVPYSYGTRMAAFTGCYLWQTNAQAALQRE